MFSVSFKLEFRLDLSFLRTSSSTSLVPAPSNSTAVRVSYSSSSSLSLTSSLLSKTLKSSQSCRACLAEVLVI